MTGDLSRIPTVLLFWTVVPGGFPMVTIRRVAAATVIGVMVLAGAACGGDDDEANVELRGEVAGQFQDVLRIDGEQADCLAAQMIGIYGPEEMQQFVDNPDTYVPAREVSPEVTQKALEDCGISPMELVREGNLEGDTGQMPTEDTVEP
jgi:hypothetical protein